MISVPGSKDIKAQEFLPNFPCDHGGGEVPGSNKATYTDWLADCKDTVRSDRGRHGIAVEAGSFLREPFKEGGGIHGFRLGVCCRLSILPRYERSNVVFVLDHKVVPFSKELGAVTGRGLAEGGEGMLGRRDGFVGVGFVELGTGAN